LNNPSKDKQGICFSFSLDGKRNKKIKAKANAPLLLPGQRT